MNDSLNVKVNRFAAQRGFELISIPHDWKNKKQYSHILKKIGSLDDFEWTIDDRESTPTTFLMGAPKHISRYLNEPVDASTNSRLWFIAGIVERPTTVNRFENAEKHSGPVVYVLGSITAKISETTTGKQIAVIKSLSIFPRQLSKYVHGWSNTLRRGKPSSPNVTKQMRREIVQTLIAKMIANYDERKRVDGFQNNTAFRLVFEDIGRKKVLRSSIVRSYLEDLLVDQKQEIVDQFVCSDEIDEPEYLPGGKVRLPSTSDVCQAKMNKSALRGAGRLFQSYLNHQLQDDSADVPSETKSKTKKKRTKTIPKTKKSKSKSKSKTTSMPPLERVTMKKLIYSNDDDSSPSSSSSSTSSSTDNEEPDTTDTQESESEESGETESEESDESESAESETETEESEESETETEESEESETETEESEESETETTDDTNLAKSIIKSVTRRLENSVLKLFLKQQ